MILAFARIGAPSNITFIYDSFFLHRGKNSSGQGFAHGPFHPSGGGGGCQQGLDGISHAGTLQLPARALPFGGCDLKMAGATVLYVMLQLFHLKISQWILGVP